jgi:putative transposase
LTDAQRDLIRPLVEAKTGRKAAIDRRQIVNAILYVARTGCQWRNLPNDFPNWSTVYTCYHRWAWNGTLDNIHAELRAKVRSAYSRSEQPTAAIIDSQSVKTTSKGGSPASSKEAMMAPKS